MIAAYLILQLLLYCAYRICTASRRLHMTFIVTQLPYNGCQQRGFCHGWKRWFSCSPQYAFHSNSNKRSMDPSTAVTFANAQHYPKWGCKLQSQRCLIHVLASTNSKPSNLFCSTAGRFRVTWHFEALFRYTVTHLHNICNCHFSPF